jgi:hypothetical protein
VVHVLDAMGTWNVNLLAMSEILLKISINVLLVISLTAKWQSGMLKPDFGSRYQENNAILVLERYYNEIHV